MSSGTRYEPNAGRHVSSAMGDKFLSRNENLGMSARQQELNHFYSYYQCVRYDARRVDWNGRPVAGVLETEAIARGSFIPPGFYDAGGQTMPVQFRKPTAPYNLVRTIVDRFTGMLFSERRHPHFRVEGDPDTEDFVHALAEASRLWPTMIGARRLGGAMGSVAVGFQFREGRPIIEVHDPRWTSPEFADRVTRQLKAIEKRYMFPVEKQDEKGRWYQEWYWYRRTIDEQQDVLYKPAPVGEGEMAGLEPIWEPEEVADHRLGFCPVVWVQNMPESDDPDGDPDCLGVFEMSDAIDALIAQANRGVLANSDPSLLLITNAAIGEVVKGSENAIKLPEGGSAAYMEIAGTGPKAARELAQEMRAMVLEVAQCVLDEAKEAAAKTATEIERRYSSMLAKLDVMREQYGQRCVLPLMDMMVRAARKLSDGGIESEPDPDTGEDKARPVRYSLDLPPRFVKGKADGDGNAPGRAKQVERRLGPGGVLQLQWPRYFDPTLTDITMATEAAMRAKLSGLVDDEHASNFVAELFDVEDVPAMLAKVKSEAKEHAEELDAMMMQRMGQGGGGKPPSMGGGGMPRMGMALGGKR